MSLADFVWYIFHLIGSAMPLAVLCYIIVFIVKGRKVKSATLISYIVVAALMFGVLLRT